MSSLSFRPSLLLRRALVADAAISGATGLLMALGAGFLAGLLGLPEVLLRGAGIALLPFVVFVAWLAARRSLSRPAVWAVIAANALWAADCVLLLLTGWLVPSALGYAFVTVQAAAVGLFAELQYFGLRRSTGASATAAV